MNSADIIKASIGEGEAAAISSGELKTLAGLSERELRKAIEHLRREGLVIASNSKGYFKPADLYELERYIEQETKRAKSVLYTLKTAKRYRAELALKSEFSPNSRLDEEKDGAANG